MILIDTALRQSAIGFEEKNKELLKKISEAIQEASKNGEYSVEFESYISDTLKIGSIQKYMNLIGYQVTIYSERYIISWGN